MKKNETKFRFHFTLNMAVPTGIEPAISCVTGRHVNRYTTGPLIKLREQDLNLRPSGYEPDELPNCSIPRRCDGGGRGIRTPARFDPPVGFQDRSLQPDLGIPPKKVKVKWWTRSEERRVGKEGRARWAAGPWRVDGWLRGQGVSAALAAGTGEGG